MTSYRGALARRMDYLLVTGRLSERNRHELDVLSHQLRELERSLPASPEARMPAIHTQLVSAFRREIARYGWMVMQDAREQRERAMLLRERARRCRAAVERATARSRLRVLGSAPQLDLEMLQAAFDRKAKAS